MANLPPAGKPHYVGASTLMPLLGARSGFAGKAHVIPILATIIAGVLIPLEHDGKLDFIQLTTGPNADLPGVNGAIQICWTLGALATFLVIYYVYMLCGRRKPWWLLLGVVIAMVLLMVSTPLGTLVGAYNDWANPMLAPTIHGAFFGPGLGEELAKAMPIFFLAWVGGRKARWAQSVGVLEPLDGILIGVASAAGFTLAETLGGYAMMPVDIMGENLKQLLAGCEAGTPLCNNVVELGAGTASYHAVTIALMRVVPEASGHMAYSGVFGYFIGLAVARPASAWRIVLIGWISAAVLHGLWDAVAGLGATGVLNAGEQNILCVFLALLSYVFLASAILKARKLSPTRAENFATVLADQAPPLVPAGAPMSSQAVPSAAVAMSGSAAALVLKIGTVTRTVAPGTVIEPMHLGLAGAGRGNGPIAEIVPNPGDASMLGLRNLSDRIYRAVLPSGEAIDIARGETARLASGVVIDFGGIEGRVQPA